MKQKIRTKIAKYHSKGLETLSSKQCRDLLENLIKIDCKLPHQNLVCKIGFEKALLENDWSVASQFFATAYLNESIINCDEIIQWKFVRNSTPVYINNELHLFPMTI